VRAIEQGVSCTHTYARARTTDCNVPVVITLLRSREVRRSNGDPETGHHIYIFFLWVSLVIADVGTVPYTRPTPFPHLFRRVRKTAKSDC
jgi:hypothetical protein